MSFQAYVDHITQKYRLAVAISVIKTKPQNLSIEEYLTCLQNKIKDKELDPNETVCSDDFNFDDDDIVKQNNVAKSQTDIKCDMINENRLDHSNNENNSEASQTILNDFLFEKGRQEFSVEGETCIGDTLRLLKEVASATQEEDYANQHLSQLTFCESQEANNDVTHCSDADTNAMEDNMFIHNNNENNCTDSQETQLYTLHGFTQDYTHVSQTQNEYLVVADKYIRNKATNGNNKQGNVHKTGPHDGNDIQMYINDEDVFALTVETRDSIVKSTVGSQQTVDNHCGNTQPSQLHQNFKDTTDNVYKDSNVQVTKVANEGVIQNVYNTQMFELELNNACEKLSANTYTDEDSELKKLNDVLEMTTVIKANKETVVGKGTPLLSFHSLNTLNNEIEIVPIEHKNNNCKDSQKLKEAAQNSTDVQEFNDNIENNDMEIDDTGSEDNKQEKVPFKVIEELNRVKNFVNKKDKKYDGYSTDSGYRSDSQLRSSLKTPSQLHGAWLNQSAHCLFNHVLQATATDDIVKQIAQVLGKLIDKLHEEENYPPFLEELLETVDSMLLEVRVGGGWADNVLLTKDDNIQRLLLLNKSKHILKYSIEKITITLEELHKKLTQDLYELNNVVEMENTCYIFHILEILLKRYMKVKDTSETSQNSQEEIFPTRSSITELWRKKWYPNSNKEVIKNENKICILKRCSEILNKIIVECMDGYSLVAFTALQCFNLIQG